jgi:hypothetical protein
MKAISTEEIKRLHSMNCAIYLYPRKLEIVISGYQYYKITQTQAKVVKSLLGDKK